jgi:hypothetical protein
MVDRRTISPRQFAESMYVPEENQQFQDLQSDPEYRKKLIEAALQASIVLPMTGAYSTAARGYSAAPKLMGRASEYAKGLETAAGGISPAEMAVIQAKYPGRFINPQTGFPQSVRNATGQTEAAMGATRDPFARLIEGAEAAPAAVRDYLTKPRPVVNPETGYVLRNMEQGANWGKPRAEWTMGQRAAQGAAMGAPIAAATYALSPNEQPINPGRGSVVEQPGERYASEVGPGRGMVVEQPGERYAGEVGAGRGFINEGAGERAAYERAQAIETAKQRMAAPMPQRRPEEFQAQPGGLASLFSGKNYQSKGGELRQDGRINWGDSDNAADFFRASKALQETPEASGMNRGGAANGKPDKNEAIHRALDIISHLVGHRR